MPSTYFEIDPVFRDLLSSLPCDVYVQRITSSSTVRYVSGQMWRQDLSNWFSVFASLLSLRHGVGMQHVFSMSLLLTYVPFVSHYLASRRICLWRFAGLGLGGTDKFSTQQGSSWNDLVHRIGLTGFLVPDVVGFGSCCDHRVDSVSECFDSWLWRRTQ